MYNDIFDATESKLKEIHDSGHKRFDVSTDGFTSIGESDSLTGALAIVRSIYDNKAKDTQTRLVTNICEIDVTDGVTGDGISFRISELNKLYLQLKVLGVIK